MKKTIWKKSVAILLVVNMLFLMGCESKQENEDTKDMVYEENLLSIEEVEGEIGAIAYKDDKIYFSASQLMESTNSEENESTFEEGEESAHKEYEDEYTVVTKLYSMSMDGSDLQELLCHITKPMEILHIMVEEDTINFVMDYYDEDTEQNDFFLVKIDKDGRELLNVNLAEVIKTQEEYYLNNVVMDASGRVVVITEQTAYILNDKFEMVGEVKSEDYISGIAVGKDGEIICATNGAFMDDAGSMQVRVLDVDHKKWGKKYKIKTGGFSGSNCIMDGYEYDFCYRDDSGVYGYDIEEKTGVKLMDYVASYLTGERIANMISLPDGRFACNIADLSVDGLGIAVYTKVDPASIQDRVTLTYGGIFIDESVKKAALDFNRTNKAYQIEFIDYSSDSEDPIVKMNADMIAGNIPDIIDLNYISVEQYVKKGLLEDLSSYVEKDSEIRSDDFIESVWEVLNHKRLLCSVVRCSGGREGNFYCI